MPLARQWQNTVLDPDGRTEAGTHKRCTYTGLTVTWRRVLLQSRFQVDFFTYETCMNL